MGGEFISSIMGVQPSREQRPRRSWVIVKGTEVCFFRLSAVVLGWSVEDGRRGGPEGRH